jgi:glycosyltransferase involved in cell wall biosynthesis
MFVDDQMGSGGPLTVALNQCAELRRRGHDAQLLAGWRGEGLPPTVLEGVPAHLLRVGGRGQARPTGTAAARFTARLTTWLRHNASTFDLVHIHLSRELVPLLTASLVERAGLPCVIQTHGDLSPAQSGWDRLADHTLTVPALRAASCRLAIDPAERDAVAALIGSHEAIHLLPDGVPAGPNRAERTSGPLDVVTVGRLHPDKEILTFARAASAALELGLDATFSVIGPDEGELAALEQLIATEEHLHGRLRYEGALAHEQVLDRLARADLFVLPAADGARSMALLEALAAGVPSICTSDCRNALTLRARQAAMVTRPNEFALAQAIVRLADDVEERIDLGRRGRLFAALAFDMGAVADALEEQYALALACRHPAAEEPAHDPLGAGDGDAGQQQLIDVSASAPIEPLEGTDRMLWVATEVTRHRLALWREVAKLSDLTVALLAPSRSNGRVQLDSAAEPFHVVQLRAEARTGAHGIPVYQATRALRTLIRRRPDAVVLDGWESPAFHAAARWARREQIPVVASYRVAGERDAAQLASGEGAAPGGARVGRIQRRLLRRADAVLASGAESVTAAIGLGVPADRISLLPDQGLGEGSSVIDVREGHRFLFLGPLISRTNPDGLVRAFHLAQGLGDVLTIAGSGPLYGPLVELADQLGILDSVIFLDEQDPQQRAQALADAHTVVVPSTDEIWGRVVTESVEAGRHVVVSTACSIAGSVESLPTVFVADPAPSGLARAMIFSRQRWTITQAEKIAAEPLLVTLAMPPELARAGAPRPWL